MKRVAAGEHHAAYEFGRLTLISLRDGYVDMPVTRLRQRLRRFRRCGAGQDKTGHSYVIVCAM